MAIHRTAQGRALDMSTLASKNEKVRAVGNMNVNARGDVLDNQNNVINDNSNRVKSAYKKTVSPQTENPVAKVSNIAVDGLADLSDAEREMFDDHDEDIQK